MIKVKTAVDVTGFDDLEDRIDAGVSDVLDFYAKRTAIAFSLPSVGFETEDVSFYIRGTGSIIPRRDVGTTNKRYIDINNGFLHKTAFTKDFEPKTRPNFLGHSSGAGMAFPNRRREFVMSEPRNWDKEAVEFIVGSGSILTIAKKIMGDSLNG